MPTILAEKIDLVKNNPHHQWSSWETLMGVSSNEKLNQTVDDFMRYFDQKVLNIERIQMVHQHEPIHHHQAAFEQVWCGWSRCVEINTEYASLQNSQLLIHYQHDFLRNVLMISRHTILHCLTFHLKVDIFLHFLSRHSSFHD